MPKRLLVVIMTIVVGLASASVVAAGVRTFTFYHDNPEWQDNWTKIGEVSAQEIGIKMEPVPYDTEVYKTRIKTDLPTPRAPALFKWWFAYRAKELVDAGLVEDLSEVWDAAGDNVVAGLRQALSFGDFAYGAVFLSDYWVWYYSVPLFEKYGLKPPQTWDEFMDQLAFFKSQGISGIGNTIGKSRWTSFIVFQEILYRIDAGFYNNLVAGRAHWTDKTVVQAMEIWKEMLDKGYFAPMDARYVEDFPGMFKRGELAYAPFGDWYSSILMAGGLKPGKDFDVCVLPPITEKGQGAIITEVSPLIVGKNSPDKDLAKEWIKWWLSSSKAAEARWDLFHPVPWDKLTPKEVVGKSNPEFVTIMKLTENYPNKLIRFWEATPVEIVEHAVDQFEQMLIRPSTYKQILDSMEKKATEVWPKYGVKY